MSLTKQQIKRQLQLHVASALYDETAGLRRGAAIYSLSDPRDTRCVHYIGQTTQPQQRFSQHLNTARLWLPDELPWWVPSPKLRPLYEWIRVLYGDELRLPTMVVHEWCDAGVSARQAERRRIYECLSGGLPLLNWEAQRPDGQLLLI